MHMMPSFLRPTSPLLFSLRSNFSLTKKIYCYENGLKWGKYCPFMPQAKPVIMNKVAAKCCVCVCTGSHPEQPFLMSTNRPTPEQQSLWKRKFIWTQTNIHNHIPCPKNQFKFWFEMEWPIDNQDIFNEACFSGRNGTSYCTFKFAFFLV